MKDQERIRSLSNVLEQIDDAVLMTDRTGNITFANQAFYKHTGYSKAETIGHNANILKSGHHDQVFYTKMWEIILSGKVFRNQLINRKKNGEIYYEQKTITPVKDEYGDVISFVSTSQDITMTIEMTKKTREDGNNGSVNRDL
jgi:PAS domain S-box-containing protein